MTDIDDQSYRRLYLALEEKLTKISEDIGYLEEPPGSKEYEAFEKAWSSYLRGLNIIRMIDEKIYIGDERLWVSDPFWVSDPLYTTGRWVLMDMEVANRILALGLP